MKTRSWPLLFPTRIAGGLIFILAVMWYASASQNNAANYLVLFCTIGIFLVSIPHTFLNLGGLKLSAESVKPAFAGQEVALPVEIMNASRKARFACVVRLAEHDDAAELVDEIPAGKAARATLRFQAEARGEHEIAQLQLRSSYPFGFFAASKRVSVRQRYIVYPKPEGDPALPLSKTHSRDAVPQSHASEGDDYAGVRAYVPGESQRQIDWKAVARGQPLMTKQFTAEADDLLQLDFATLSSLDTEQRLSQLARWIIEAERTRRRYALRLPNAEIPSSSGEAHYHRCLRALAVYR